MNEVAADPLAVMLEARSVALVGASPRPGSLGARMIEEVAKSAGAPRQYLVNPRYDEIGGVRCFASLADLPEPVDLALLAVPDTALEHQLSAAATVGVGSAVIFGSAFDHAPVGHSPADHDAAGHHGAAGHGGAGEKTFADSGWSGAWTGPTLRDRLVATASGAGIPVCGAGCMGFVNVARGLRAIGYTEPDPLPAGPVALVTHSGSVFSALLRTRRAFGFTVAVSSGQELVTSAAAYARYALTLPETKVLALVLEAIRDAVLLRTVLADAADRDVPVVLLPAGTSAASRSLVAAHSGALAAGDGAWQALAAAHGVHRVGDLAELADTLELFCAGRRAWGDRGRPIPVGQDHVHTGSGAPDRTDRGGAASTHDSTSARPHGGGGGASTPEPRSARPHDGGGIATVHDSGFERAHIADVAASVGVPFAALADQTRQRLAAVLDPGLEPGNPLDVWGTGRDSEELFTESLSALADDPGVGAVALAVDLVTEYDGDDSYREAVLTAAAKTDKPVVVLASIPAAIDPVAATRLRDAGIPVLESTRSGLLALNHLLTHTANQALNPPPPPPIPLASDDPQTASASRDQATAPMLAEPPPPAAARLPAPAPGSAVPALGSAVSGGSAPALGFAGSGGSVVPGGSAAARRARWISALTSGPIDSAGLFELLRDYGVPAVAAHSAATPDQARAAAAMIGYPVALKTDEPGIAHKSDVGGVRLNLAGLADLDAAYADLAARLGPRVTVTAMADPGVELILGMARDPALGPLIVVGAGGVLAEYQADRAVALPPLTEPAAADLIARQRFARLLDGFRGSAAVDRAAVAAAVAAFSALVTDLADHFDAFEVNPLICSAAGVLAVDALAVPASANG